MKETQHRQEPYQLSGIFIFDPRREIYKTWTRQKMNHAETEHAMQIAMPTKISPSID